MSAEHARNFVVVGMALVVVAALVGQLDVMEEAAVEVDAAAAPAEPCLVTMSSCGYEQFVESIRLFLDGDDEPGRRVIPNSAEEEFVVRMILHFHKRGTRGLRTALGVVSPPDEPYTVPRTYAFGGPACDAFKKGGSPTARSNIYRQQKAIQPTSHAEMACMAVESLRLDQDAALMYAFSIDLGPQR